MDNGGSSECKMWLENVEVFMNSSSSADELMSVHLIRVFANDRPAMHSYSLLVISSVFHLSLKHALRHYNKTNASFVVD